MTQAPFSYSFLWSDLQLTCLKTWLQFLPERSWAMYLHVPRRGAWPLGSWWILPPLSPTEEPAHRVCSCAHGKGLQQECLPLLTPRWIQLYRHTELYRYLYVIQLYIYLYRDIVTQIYGVITLPHRPSCHLHTWALSPPQHLSAYWNPWQQMDTHKRAAGGERCAQSHPSWKTINSIRSTKSS